MSKISLNQYDKLHILIVKYKNLDYQKFFEFINSELEEQVDFKTLQQQAIYIRKQVSSQMGKDMINILNYVLAKKKNDKEKVKQLKPIIERIQMNIQETKKIPNRNTTRNEESMLDTLENYMKQFMNEEITKDELKSKQGFSIQNIKKNLSKIDTDKYVEFIIKYDDLEAFDEYELNHFVEVLEYFIFYLDINIDKLCNLNPYNKKDQEAIINFKVNTQEKLDSQYSQRICNLYNWKIHRLERLKDYYMKLKDSIVDVLKMGDIGLLFSIDSFMLNIIKEDEPLVYEEYILLHNIRKINSLHVKSLHYVSDIKKKEIDELFAKKLNLRNNN